MKNAIAQSLFILTACLSVSACSSRAPLPTLRAPLIPATSEEFRQTPPPISPTALNVVVPQNEEKTLTNGLKVIAVQMPEYSDFEIRLVSQRGDDGAWPRSAVRVARDKIRDQLNRKSVYGYFSTGGSYQSNWIAFSDTITPDAPMAFPDPKKTKITTETPTPQNDAVAALSPWLKRLYDGVVNFKANDEAIQSRIDQMKRTVKEEQEWPSAAASVHANDYLYEGTPLNERARAQYIELSKLTTKDIRDAAHERFVPESMALIVVSPFSTNDVIASVEGVFGKWTHSIRQKKAPILDHWPETPAASHLYNTSQSHMIFSQRMLSEDNADFEETYVGLFALAGLTSSVLNHELRVERGITYGVHLNNVNGNYGRAVRIQTSIDPDASAEAIQAIFTQLNQARKHELPNVLIDRAKRKLARQYASRWQRPNGVVSEVQQAFLLKQSLDERAKLSTRFLGVSPTSSQKALAKHLDPKHGFLTIFGKFHDVKGWIVQRDDTGWSLLD